MPMQRREFLRLLAWSVPALNLDLDKLLWVPGQKKIFLPSPSLSIADIVACELMHILPYLQYAFEKDDDLYQTIKNRKTLSVIGPEIRIPLRMKV